MTRPRAEAAPPARPPRAAAPRLAADRRAAPRRAASRRAAVPLAALLLGACVPGPRPCCAPEPEIEPAARPVVEAERTLLARPGAVVRFRAVSEGRFPAHLRGTLYLGAENRARLEASGRFGERSGDLLLVSDGTWMQLHDFDGWATERRTPPRLNESLVVGLLRMGILHNLARLHFAEGPDRAAQGPGGWVRPVGASSEDADGAGRVLRFGIEVDGTPTADAVLRLDGRGLPVERTQTVRFEGGEMRVEERYPLVRVGVSPEPSLFEREPIPF